MNNRNFLNELAKRTNRTPQETEKLVGDLLSLAVEHFDKGDALSVSSFGVFEVKKKNERISVNPSTGKRTLIPPKLSLSFKQGNALKDRLNTQTQAE